MDRVSVDGGHVVAQAQGEGPPVLLIHGSLLASAWDPILDHPALRSFQLILWHRRGYGDSSAAPAGFSLQDQAADAAAVLAYYGVSSAHIVGHSFGGRIALRLLADRSDIVKSLTLLESGGPPVASLEDFRAVIEFSVASHEAGDDAAALDSFLSYVGGSDYRVRCDDVLPQGWFRQMLVDVHNFFDVELPSASPFESEFAREIDFPVLIVVGEKSPRFFQDGFAWLTEHIDRADTYRLPHSSHIMQVDNPTELASRVARFLASQTT